MYYCITSLLARIVARNKMAINNHRIFKKEFLAVRQAKYVKGNL